MRPTMLFLKMFLHNKRKTMGMVLGFYQKFEKENLWKKV